MDNKKAIEGLRVALQTELNGIEFYRLAAERTGDEKAKTVFRTLANDEAVHFAELVTWEQKHLEAIARQINLIKEDYWAQANFTPLF